MKKSGHLDGEVKVNYQFIDKYENVIQEKHRYDYPEDINKMRDKYLFECTHNDVVAVNVVIIGE